MKTLRGIALLAPAFFTLNASAQTKLFRAYSGELKAASGEAKKIELIIDTEIHEHRQGDPEIPNHGFIRRYVELRLNEGNRECSRALYLDEGVIRLCSGAALHLDGESPLKEENLKAALYVEGFVKAMGEAQLKLDYVQDGIHEGSIDETN